MKRLMENAPISRKVLLALSVMALTGLGTGWYALANLTANDAHYTRLLEGEAEAALLATRGYVSVVDAGRLLNRLVAETEEARMRAVQHPLQEARTQVGERLSEAGRALPAIAGEAEAVRRLYGRVVEVGVEVEAASLAGDKDRALRLMAERYDPLAMEVRRAARALVAQVGERKRNASAAVGAGARAAWWNTLVASLLGLGLSVALALWLIQAQVSRPINGIVGRMRALASGEKDSPVPHAGRRDEVGAMAEALEAFRLAALEQDRMAAAAAAEQAARQARAERVEALVRSFEADAAEALRVVASASTELAATAQQMQDTAQAGSQTAASLAATSGQASANVQSAAASAEEMAASIAEVARQVGESARMSREAAEQARSTDATVVGLAEAAQRIGEVVRLIGTIAGQTNLLALNATIEAARAGEHGKGFAVVASEVKALAAQTARATEEISGQIGAMQAETGQAVEAIRVIGQIIGSLDEVSAQVAAAAQEQSTAVGEIGRAVAEAATGTREVSRNAGDATEAAQQTGAAASQVRSASGELAERAEGLRRQVDGFLAGIRAA